MGIICDEHYMFDIMHVFQRRAIYSVDKDIERHTMDTIVSWPNPKKYIWQAFYKFNAFR